MSDTTPPADTSQTERAKWASYRQGILDEARAVIETAYDAIAAQAAATERERERERLLSALTSWLPQYVCSVVHGRTADGDPVYASGAVAFPEALVTTFTIMYDHDLTGGHQTTRDTRDGGEQGG